MKFGGAFSRESITAIWIAAALRCRIPLGDIRALVRTLPTEYSFLSIIDPTPLTDTRKASILKVVADSINDKTRQWFVMRMRSGRTPDDIRQAIEYNVPDLYGDTSFFYPTRVRYREGKGKKMVKEEVPYIPGILFFKTRRDRVGKLFSKIGDMAWCYKYTNTPGSPYSTISRREMEKFQRHIGKFSDDIKMELVTDTGSRFAVDDVVKINGGMMAGSVGVITAVHNQDGTTTYTLQLSSDSACVWTVKDMEEIYIEKV